jgi:toxin CcdB
VARYDVYRVRGEPYAIDCQADYLSHLKSRFIVPLRPPTTVPTPMMRLNPLFTVEGRELLMVTQFARAIPLREIEATICSLEAYETRIQGALDMLITGV